MASDRLKQPTIVVAAGPRSAEEVVLGWLEERLDGPGAKGDPAERLTLLAEPVRVVVPSKSLRMHFSAALVRRRGRSAAGVVVQTLDHLARAVVETAGEPLPTGEALFETMVRRTARETEVLARHLDELSEGYHGVAGTVRDFLDAGFEPELADGVVEAALQDDVITEGGRPVGTESERERAEALARLAASVEEKMVRRGLGRSSHLLRRADALLALDPGLLPTRGLLVHGFADATGLRADLIQTLMRLFGATVVVAQPPDLADASEGGAKERLARPAESAFTRRFLDRIDAVAGAVRTEAEIDPLDPPRIHATCAPGADAEAREVARRVRSLQDAGARPEGIGVVARSLAPEQPFATALRRHFGRLGVPFSGVDGGPASGTGPLLPAGRRLLALLEVLRRGESVPADRWLDATAPPRRPAADPRRRARGVDLRLALHTLGAARLREVARLDRGRLGRFEKHGFPLPIREGFRALEDGGEDGGERALPRRVPVAALLQAAEDAGRLVRLLADWPDPAPLSVHLERLRTLLTEELGWEVAADLESDPLLSGLAGLEPSGRLEISHDELVLLLSRALDGAGRDAMGGAGGGVALLDAMEARGRTFEHLFLVGLNRGVFPRPIREDPLLADDLRRLLLGVLPDLPVKSRGFDEERHLFAQLLSAAPEVTLSWWSTTEEGEPHPRSPLVDRLGIEPEPISLEEVVRPAAEHAVAAGLAGDRDAFEALLAVALREERGAEEGAGGTDWSALAGTHRRVLDELDPDLSTPEGRRRHAALGPYFGFVGPAGPGDPRRAELWVTTLEGVAACPWQTFLGRVLRVEPTPDPLQAVPGLDALSKGSLVHAVLEEVVRRALPEDAPESLHEAAEREAVAVAWPADDEIEEILRRKSVALLADQGISMDGLARALAEAVRPHLAAAREAEWPADGSSPHQGRAPDAVAAEVPGALTVRDAAGAERQLRFRADRVDLLPDRRNTTLRLTDYKTGRPISEAVRETTRTGHFLAAVERGERLQAVAYALAAGDPSPFRPSAEGRYLFLKPGTAPEHRVFGLRESNRPFTEAFERAVRTGIEAWDRGAFFPRLVEAERDQEPRRCAWCALAEACLRGDSGARRRLRDWADEGRQGTLPETEGGGGEPASAALLGVWTLHASDGGGSS